MLLPRSWANPVLFVPTVQGDHLPDEQHPARAFPLVPFPAGTGGLCSHLRAAGLDGRSRAHCVHCAGHGCPCALWGLCGEWLWENCTEVGRKMGSGNGFCLADTVMWESGCCYGWIVFNMYCFV